MDISKLDHQRLVCAAIGGEVLSAFAESGMTVEQIRLKVGDRQCAATTLVQLIEVASSLQLRDLAELAYAMDCRIHFDLPSMGDSRAPSAGTERKSAEPDMPVDTKDPRISVS